jgi:hypothetical protein
MSEQAWQEATGCKSPQEFREYFVVLQGDIAKAQAELAARLNEWKRVTGFDSPGAFEKAKI